jgi:hypothetical protein
MPTFIKTGFWDKMISNNPAKAKAPIGWLNLDQFVNSKLSGATSNTCPLDMKFKPGSVGQKVSFTKTSGSDPNTNKDVIIPGELEITRGNNRGIYNIALESSYDNEDYVSPLNTYWSSRYTDTSSNSLAPLTDIPNRNYSNWRDAVDSNPPASVGMTMIMKWDNGSDTPRYWVVEFTEWGIGDDGYNNFGYTRYELFLSADVEQPDATNTNTPQVIDIVSPGVHLTRRYTGGGLYNIVSESSYDSDISPENTRWNSEYTDPRSGYSGYDNLANITDRIYGNFYDALDGSIGNNIPGTPLVMHDLTTDLYHKVEFTEWSQGCGNGSAGGMINYNITYPGSGYPDGGYYNIDALGGSGTDISILVFVTGGEVTDISINNRGKNYEVGDIITLAYPGVVTDPATIEITEICSMGGFAYTRTVIPQSCGIKFADGTVMNTASTGGGGGPIAVDNSSLYSTDPGTSGFSTNNGIFLGANAGSGATNASYSNFIGNNAGGDATNASYSNFLGSSAGYQATNAYQSNFFGSNAGSDATDASSSNFFGIDAGNGATAANGSNFIGPSAGQNATDAQYSNFLGANAGISATGAFYSNFFGQGAGEDATDAYHSNFFGASAGLRASNASESTFIGFNTGIDATNASNSVFFGFQAGYEAADANNSNFFGREAGYQATNSNNSNFIGFAAGTNATDAYNSNFIGQQAGKAASDANNSNFIGTNAGQEAATAAFSNFIGSSAGFQATNATLSNFIGANAGTTATNAYDSVFIGSNAGNGATDANNSVFIGNEAGISATDAQASVFIGAGAGKNSTGKTVIALGPDAASGNTLDGQTVIANTSLPSFANHAAAALALTVVNGASAGSTYLYHNQATNSIGAVRL